MEIMRGEVVICTRNRYAEVRRLLADLVAMKETRPVLVADSSDDDSTRAVVEGIGSKLDVRYVRCEPGLTRQRQAAISALRIRSNAVHFIDDDVLVEPSYFAELEKVLASSSTTVGAGGLITNLPDHNPWWLRRVFLSDTARGGAVLRSGVNVLYFGTEDVARVDWLSGCSMSYRRSVFDLASFDTRMEGYCPGEDVDFSYRLRCSGFTLIATRLARLQHLCSTVNRADADSAYASQLRRRYLWVSEMRDCGLSIWAFHWSVLGELVIVMGQAVFRARRSALRRAWTILRTWVGLFLMRTPAPNPRLARTVRDG